MGPDIRARVTVDGVITVVDGPAVAAGRFADDPAAVAAQREADDNLDHDNPLADVYGDQIAAADLVILNKADLLDPAALADLRTSIAAALPRPAALVTATEGRVDLSVLLGLDAAAEDDLATRPSCHDAVDGEHEHDDFDSFSLPIPETTDPDALLRRLTEVAGTHDVLRMKGFVSVSGRPMRLAVQGVGTRFRQHYDRAWAAGEPRNGQLVVIGQTGARPRRHYGCTLGRLMHLLVRETRSLDEAAPAVDLAHGPADLVVLSFSDADLGALAASDPGTPSLRLAPLGKLRHPMSVDLYLEQTVARARCVVLRLLGGLDYWRYGTEELAALCRERAIPLAVLPGDGRADPALAALSTVPAEMHARLDGFFRHGGRANMRRALGLMAHLAGLGPDDGHAAEALPQHGVHTLDLDDRPLAAVVFYRSHLLSDDIAPIAALTEALRSRGLAVGTLFAGSLKAPETAVFVARNFSRVATGRGAQCHRLLRPHFFPPPLEGEVRGGVANGTTLRAGPLPPTPSLKGRRRRSFSSGRRRCARPSAYSGGHSARRVAKLQPRPHSRRPRDAGRAAGAGWPPSHHRHLVQARPRRPHRPRSRARRHRPRGRPCRRLGKPSPDARRRTPGRHRAERLPRPGWPAWACRRAGQLR